MRLQVALVGALTRLSLVGLVSSVANAPLQCGHTTDAALREDETPGDALWDLSQRFAAAHDPAGQRRTLEYLVERYPSSRWIPQAREVLAGGGAGANSGADSGA